MSNKANTTVTTVAVSMKMDVVKKGRFVRAKTAAEMRKGLKLKPASQYKIHKLMELPVGR